MHTPFVLQPCMLPGIWVSATKSRSRNLQQNPTHGCGCPQPGTPQHLAWCLLPLMCLCGCVCGAAPGSVLSFVATDVEGSTELWEFDKVVLAVFCQAGCARAYTCGHRCQALIVNSCTSCLVKAGGLYTPQMPISRLLLRNALLKPEPCCHNDNVIQEAMDEAQTIHDSIIRSHLPKFNGCEVATEGDAFLCAFWKPTDAVGWCIAVQQVSAALGWLIEVCLKRLHWHRVYIVFMDSRQAWAAACFLQGMQYGGGVACVMVEPCKL